MKPMKDFKQFLLRGNVVDLAVGVVIGAAFGAVVTALVADMITPILSIPGDTNFDQLTFDIGGGTFRYGHFFNTVLTFVIIAAVVFFFVVVPVNHLMARRRTETDVDSVNRDCPECLSSIPREAKRCAFCTAEIAPAVG